MNFFLYKLHIYYIIFIIIIVIPKSITPSRIEENFKIAELPQEDFDKIKAITFRQRSIAPLDLFPDYGDF